MRFLLALALFAGCNANDPKAQATPSGSQKTAPKTAADKAAEDLATQQVEHERNQREQVTDEQTRASYRATAQARLAKLDAAIAARKEVPAGLQARRDELAQQITDMPATSGTSWAAYTKGVDAAFGAIEHDLGPN